MFRLEPDAACFRFGTRGQAQNARPFDEEREVAALLSYASQSMISWENFVSMGVGEDGSSSLRLKEDLTRGSTSNLMGFDEGGMVGDAVRSCRFVRKPLPY